MEMTAAKDRVGTRDNMTDTRQGGSHEHDRRQRDGDRSAGSAMQDDRGTNFFKKVRVWTQPAV